MRQPSWQRITFRSGAVVLGLLTAALASGAPSTTATAPKLSSGQTAHIEEALNRLTWGAAPGEAAQIKQLGLQHWIQLQLHPDQIPENPILVHKLAPLATLRMTPEQLEAAIPPGFKIRQMAMGKLPLPSDPKARAIAEVELANFRKRTARKQDAAAPGNAMTAHGGARAQALQRLAQRLTPEQLRSLRQGTPESRVQAFLALSPELQQQVLGTIPRPMAYQLIAWAPVELQRRVMLAVAPQQVIANDLTEGRLLQAVYTNRQLEDVLTDFWFNHFNIFINKGEPERYLLASYERDAIRPHVLGKFYNLLVATAESPAMLFYLDNWRSVSPAAALAQRQKQIERLQKAQQRLSLQLAQLQWNPDRQNFLRQRLGQIQARLKRLRNAPSPGINENYGREVMELHTLGVTGGYTQKDVIEVARCFTGWTIGVPGTPGGPQNHPAFYFNARLHDNDPKTVLGQNIPGGGGMQDGLRVLWILAHSPATAHHISYELAQRFVNDEPPAALVNRMAKTFLSSDGDLRRVMETMINSPEFWSAAAQKSKIKSPMEMMVSSLRATGANVENPLRLTQLLAQMGQPLYGKEPPTGYSNVGQDWVSSAGLLSRLNFSLMLASNRLPGVRVDLAQFAPREGDALAVSGALFDDLLDGQVSPATRNTIFKALQEPVRPNAVRKAAFATPENPHPLSPAQVQLTAGLILGSPEFQRR